MQAWTRCRCLHRPARWRGGRSSGRVPPTLRDVARASVYVDARARSWQMRRAWDTLNYPRQRKEDVHEFIGRVHAFGAWMHVAPCFPTGLALGARRWSRGPELARVAVRSQSPQLCSLLLVCASTSFNQCTLLCFVLGNGMVLNTQRKFCIRYMERES